MDSYQKASDDCDMLKSCIDKMFISDDKESLFFLYMGALHNLAGIYKYCKEGLEQLDKDKTF